MKNLLRYTALCLLCSVFWFSTGCNLPAPQADTVRYFTLGAPAPVGAVTGAATVRPVRLAGHLRNRAMAVRISDNEVIYMDDARWAEPLDEAITQVIRSRLGQVAGGYSVRVQVLRCELVRSEGNTVQLQATYSISGVDSETRSGAFSATPQAWDGRDQGTLVRLVRNAVGELAEAIATATERK